MHKNNNVLIDYKQLKTCVSIIMVLDHYGWVRELKGTGNTVRSTCPIHNGSNDKQLSSTSARTPGAASATVAAAVPSSSSLQATRRSTSGKRRCGSRPGFPFPFRTVQQGVVS